MPGGVDQVQLVALPGNANRLRLDRDPSLALELHRIEQLFTHVAVGDGVGELEDPIRECRLSVVDVRDDGEVADPALVHGNQARMLAVMRFSQDSGDAGPGPGPGRESRQGLARGVRARPGPSVTGLTAVVAAAAVVATVEVHLASFLSSRQGPGSSVVLPRMTW